MENILKKIVYRALLWLDRKTTQAKVFYKGKSVSLGEGSVMYPETTIYNMRGNLQDIRIGKNSHVRGELLVFNYGGKIEIGDNTFIGVGSKVWSGELVIIGSNVLISHNVNIMDTNSHEMDHLERAEGFIKLMREGYPKDKGSIKTSPVVIEDYAWISFNAIILKGVRIGKGAVVSAGAVVTKDVPDFCLVAGNPAQVIKHLDA